MSAELAVLSQLKTKVDKIYSTTVMQGNDQSLYPSTTWTQSYVDYVATNCWTRPSDWLAMPTLVKENNTIAILFAVQNSPYNYVAFTCTGAYTVDWGDGNTQNYASGVKAEKNYTYSTFDVSNTTLTSRGYKQAIIKIYPQASNSLTTFTFSNHSFFASATQVNVLDMYIYSTTLERCYIGNDSGYNTAGAITPQLLERVKFDVTSLTTYKGMFAYCTSLRKLEGSAKVKNLTPFVATCSVSAGVATYNNHGLQNGYPVFFPACLRTGETFVANVTANTFQIVDKAGTLQSGFSSASAVFSTGVTATNMFASCRCLVSDIALDYSKISSAIYMFADCHSFSTLNSGSFNVCLDAEAIFYNCRNLRGLPTLNFNNVRSIHYAFYNCTSITEVPFLTTPTNLGSTQQSVFNGCISLTAAPMIDFANITIATSFFSQCSSLRFVPDFINTSSLNTTVSMFSSCYSLTKAPNLVLTNVTDCVSMFNSCYSLKSVPLYDLSKAQYVTNMFNSCYNLMSLPNFNYASVVGAANMLNYCKQLSQLSMTSMKVSFDATNCALSATELNNLFTSLPTVSAKTVTISGNPGSATCTPSIATAKGWTVTQ